MSEKPLYVTQPSMPPLEEFVPYLERIWQSRILTNSGPLHQELERCLRDYLGVPQIALFNNGMTALVAALRVLDLKGEVITTPYSFVATSHALLWNNLTPVFVDVEPATLNIDSAKIEDAITENTSAILAVHCYGNPCDTAAIRKIAHSNGLKVVYDAAHAFGVERRGGIFNCGDLSVLSFHATKVFNTFEGGAIVCSDVGTKRKIDQLKNFGLAENPANNTLGLNGKLNELQAAFGLLQLKYVDEALNRRRSIDLAYRRLLQDAPGIRCIGSVDAHAAGNGAYFPILVEERHPLNRDRLHARLLEHDINSRRYFYPLLSSLPLYCNLRSASPKNLPVANLAAQQVLCLPIYPELDTVDVERIANLILNC